ncbi:MAG: tetratricopeptide repeat protein [Bacteroidetes bacterium]|jgi:Flp pilus assembly protein TadD/ferredoxin|nr:tetratricopeptide repeat protein [Bacteroidota bacterium]MBK9399871.1 tetratricopeptide repeat protein [Bacteroidota bacterium]
MDPQLRVEALKKPDYSHWRVICLSLVYLLMGIHIAHWKIAGRTLAPLELNEVLYTLHLGIITAGFIFMGVALLSIVIAGRFFCSWMCHILALQDLSEWILKKLKIKPKHIRSRYLYLIPFICFGYLFLLPQIQRIYFHQPLAIWRIQSDSEGWASFITNDFWRNLPGFGITMLTFFTCGFGIIYFLGSRSFCQYVCPYGALFAMTDRIAPGKIKLTGDCNQCGKCTAVCSSHIKVHKEILHFGKVVNPNCLKDLDCVQVCPNDAIHFGFTKPTGFSSLNAIPSEKKQFDFTLKEDIALVLLFLLYVPIYFGLYDSVAFLLAATVSVILSFLTILAYRMTSLSFIRTGKIILKKDDKITIYGKYFLAIFVMLLLFTCHSVTIRYHQLTGEHFYHQVANIESNSSPELGKQETQDQVNTALHHLSFIYQWGCYRPAPLLRQLSALAIYQNDYKQAVVYLEKMTKLVPQDLEARIRLAKIYVKQNNAEEAFPLLRSLANEDVHTNHDKIIKSEALVVLGHLEENSGFPAEALLHYKKAIEYHKDNKEAWLAGGVLLTKAGQRKEGEMYLLKASMYYPASPLIENNLALIYMQEKSNDKARYHLEKLLALQPGNPQATYNLAMLKLSSGELNEAVLELKQLIRNYPEHKNAQEALEFIKKKQYTISDNEHL